VKPGDIHWVELPSSAGHEQVGRRPGIVLQDDAYTGGSPLVIIIPLTGSTAAGRFAGTMAVDATPDNGLRKASVALVFQIRAVDRRIVTERLGTLTLAQLSDVYILLDNLTGRQRG
jgi:mRNA interferase MazF